MKGGAILSENGHSSIKFTLEESVLFKSGQEVDELISISLDPNISIVEEEEIVVLRGSLNLTGEYKRIDSTQLEEGSEESFLKGRYVQEVGDRDSEECDFFHQFPVDITIPRDRIHDSNEVFIEVESFDYVMPENSRLNIVAEVHVYGLQGEQEESHHEHREQEEQLKPIEFSEHEERLEYAEHREDEEQAEQEEYEEQLEQNEQHEYAGHSEREEQLEYVEHHKHNEQLEHAEHREKIEELEHEEHAEHFEHSDYAEQNEQVESMESIPESITVHVRTEEAEEEESTVEVELVEYEAEEEPESNHTSEYVEESKEEEELYTPFMAEARSSKDHQQKPPEHHHHNQFPFPFPMLPEMDMDEVAHRLKGFFQKHSKESPSVSAVESSKIVEESPVHESSSHHESNEMKKTPEVKPKKKKDKYKSISFADFFARKEEDDSAKLKVRLVQHGDSLERLADQYGVSVQQILRANQLDPSQEVYEGQVLYIPGKTAYRK